MNKKRFAKQIAVAIGFTLLFAASGLVRAQSVSPNSTRTPRAASPGAQSMSNAGPEDDFAGLIYSDEQKAEIDKIHRDIESHKVVIAKDTTLDADQKSAMLFGYTRIEYGRIFQVLSLEQQKQVRQKILARKAEDPAAKKRQPPPNS
jgi:hypothetical protein